MRFVTLALAHAISTVIATNYDAVITSAHSRAESNRVARLNHWSNSTLVRIPSCKLFNIQNGAVGTAVAHLYINNNASQVAAANAFLVNLSHCLAPGSTGPVGQPLEMSYVTRAFALFNSKSPLVERKQVGSLSPEAESAMQDMFYRYITQFGTFGHKFKTVWDQFGSENRDAVEQTSCYLAAQTLARDPQFAQKAVPGNMTVTELANNWEGFIYEWLSEHARRGLFVELGSTNYWYRTWPAVLNLLDLPQSKRVLQRAKMFVDIAIVEAEQASISGVRGGQKSRAKKSDLGHNNGIYHNLYYSLAPNLYGDNGTSLMVSLDTNAFYRMSNVSILMHELGKAPATGGRYTIRNRLIGQLAAASTKEEEHDVGRALYVVKYAEKSDQVHHVSATKSYLLGGDIFSPNDHFSPNSMDRWTGLVFGNPTHTVVGLPGDGPGDKWCLIDDDVMIAQKCAAGGCYGGNPLVSIESASRVWQHGAWTFIEAMHAGGLDIPAWAAVCTAWGGFKGSPLGVNFTRGNLLQNDVWAPLIIVVGEQRVYRTAENFTASVIAAPLTLTGTPPAVQELSFVFQARTYQFFPNNITGKYRLPTLDGTPVNPDPPFAYNSPHLNAQFNATLIHATYEDYALDYDFATDKIIRHH